MTVWTFLARRPGRPRGPVASNVTPPVHQTVDEAIQGLMSLIEKKLAASRLAGALAGGMPLCFVVGKSAQGPRQLSCVPRLVKQARAAATDNSVDFGQPGRHHRKPRGHVVEQLGRH